MQFPIEHISFLITLCVPKTVHREFSACSRQNTGVKEEKNALDIMFLDAVQQIALPSNIRQSIYSDALPFLCFFGLPFPCSCSQFANEDAESQRFLTNGFLGKKKLADYTDEHVSDALLSGGKQAERCVIYRRLGGKTV